MSKLRYSLVFSLIAVLTAGIFMIQKKDKETLVFGTYFIPYSSDPLDYDAYIHHHAFTSVLYGLVSTNRQGTIVPLLAEGWSSSENFSTWSFKLKVNQKYSNGDLILPSHILLNFKRMAFFQNVKNSRSGVLEFLKGQESFNKISLNHEGITLNDNVLTFKFVKPMPDLLEKISFGFYSVAHPSLFNNDTGVWIDPKYVISSGSYSVDKWNENEFELVKREDLSFETHSHPIKRIIFKNFTLERKATDINNYDLIIADKSSLMVTDDFEFLGSENNLKIGYVKVYTWENKQNILSKIEVRRWLRQKFYDGLIDAGFTPTKSFFPLTLNDVDDITDNTVYTKPIISDVTIRTHTMPMSGKLDVNFNKTSIPEYFQKALMKIGEDSNVKLLQLDKDIDLDLGIEGSGIEFENYIETIRFMFLSKEGIMLPDENGKIHTELKKNSPNVNLINREIWEQAIVWPIRHYSSGYWFNKNSNIDFSEINHNSAAIDFNFLRWK